MKRMIIARRNMYVIIFTILVLVLLITGACKSATSIQTPSLTPAITTSITALTINISTKTGVGIYLVDGNGLTLYWTTKDSVGQSNIMGTTLANWPVFYSPDIAASSSLNTSDFSSITRADGSMQTTFKGWPLYYYVNDKVAGNTRGKGLDGIWFVATPILNYI